MASFATPRLHAAAAACCLHAHLSREPRQLFYGLPKANVPGDVRCDVVRCDVRHFGWLHPPPFRPLLWAEIDGVVCYPGNPPLARSRSLHAHLSRSLGSEPRHTDCRSLGSEPLAMPGAVLWAPKGNVPGDVRCDLKHFGWLHPPVPTALGQK